MTSHRDSWRYRVFALLVSAAALAPGGNAWSHHSFAAFYSGDNQVTYTGVVTKFRFTNPHGIIEVLAKGDQGVEEAWTAVTNAPGFMQRRRGWSKDIIKVGEVVTVTGNPARDGSNLVRIVRIEREDGSPIGYSRDDYEQVD